MILVLTGTQNMPFARLIDAVLAYAGEHELEAVIQAGPYKPADMPAGIKYHRYLSPNDLEAYLVRCTLVITHGGTGSIVSALEKGKKVIVMPRMKAHGEHNDDHQVEIAELFKTQGHVLLWQDGDDVASLISAAENFAPTPYESRFTQLAESIRAEVERYLD